jgi:hypothetical protein
MNTAMMRLTRIHRRAKCASSDSGFIGLPLKWGQFENDKQLMELLVNAQASMIELVKYIEMRTEMPNGE